MPEKAGYAQHALVMGLMLQGGIAAAQNLATNPGFETGDTTGWFAFGSVCHIRRDRLRSFG